MSNILITGGAGFIGTALANKLQTNGHCVTIIDLADRIASSELECEKYILDIREYKNFDIIKKKGGGGRFDLIYHLAAQTSGAISQVKPYLDIDTNIKGTLNICNFARKCSAKKIIFSSSMATYGNKEGKIKEEDLLSPLSNYGVSKVAGEYYLNMFKQYGIKNTIFRLFNVYGPGQNMLNMKQGMASIFMAQSILSNKISVTGSFERYRDFIYIDDVVDALILGLDNKTDSEIFNVGSGTATKVRELIKLILEINDKEESDFFIENIGSHEGDQFGSISDSSKIELLGWTAKISLSDGMKTMYKYAKEVLL